MSLANILVPNQYDLFCDNLTSNSLNVFNLDVQTLNTNVINAPGTSGLQILVNGTQKLVIPQTNNSIVLFDVNGGVQIYKWTLFTVGAGTQSFIMPVPPNKVITVYSEVSAYVNAGPLAPNSLSRQTSSLITTKPGPATWIADYDQIGANENAGTNAATLTHFAGGTNITAVVTGIAANNMEWSGVTYIYT